MKIERIDWVDSRGVTDHWSRIDDLEDNEPCNMVSVGWVFKEDEKQIQIAPHVGLEDDVAERQVSGVMTIPKQCITHRIRLTGLEQGQSNV